MPDYQYRGGGSGSEPHGHVAGHGHGQHSAHGLDTSDKFNKKRDLCLGFLILSAIVYVLARAGGHSVACPDVAVMTPIADTDDGDFGTIESGTAMSLNTAAPPSHKAAAPSARSSLTGGQSAPFDIGAYRKKILAQSQPYIIECAEATGGGSQEACHLPRDKRYAALDQKGVTIWMTGLSGSGKSTIASLLEEQLVMGHGKSVYRLDGDNIRTGLNRDLGFSKDDRAESVRRVGELACLFNDAGMITIVSLVSPYKEDRDEVRKRHEDQGLKFIELFMDVPLTVVQKRDPKGLYKKVAAGQLKGFTGVDDPYEPPVNPELSIKNQEMTVQAAVDIILRKLVSEGVLVGGPTLPLGLPFPDGDEIVDLLVPPSEAKAKMAEAYTLPKALLNDIDVNWLQVIAEGWAAPLKGFMREGMLLQTIHFNSVLVDPHNLTGTVDMHNKQTNFLDFDHIPPKRVSMSVPIVLPCTDFTKEAIESSGKKAVALFNKHGKPLAILRNPEIYEYRKEEVIARLFGVIDPGHPYIKHVQNSGDWLIGGEIELLERIRYYDGLDKFRLTAKETMDEFVKRGADAVVAFQTRNPIHAGHAYLMKTGRDILIKKGYKNPILWLSPLGGWTKSDDVPLDVRVKQHEAVLAEGMLDPKMTVMAIWPAPMIYAGPTEVLFHAKSRRNAGATYFVAGRDPAGMKGSALAQAHPDDDLYNGDHGRYVLTMSPGQDPLNILPFGKVYYDKRDHVMKALEPDRPDDFIEISGSKMRKLAAQGAVPCDVSHGKEIPSDLLAANCIPPGFMVDSGWDIVCDYYQNVNTKEGGWVPYSVMNVLSPAVGKGAKATGKYGTSDFKVYQSKAWDGSGTSQSRISLWHDVDTYADAPTRGDSRIVNFIVEIPMYSTAKMEVMKEVEANPIMQDTNKDGSPRYYTYGVPFFNYGLIPRTWEDSTHVDPETDAVGDNDPIDAIEVGTEGIPLPMGTIVRAKVLGSLALIDEGETDHKIIVIRESDPHFNNINNLRDLEHYNKGVVKNIKHWLKFYKTSDGKGVNQLANREIPKTPTEAGLILDEVVGFYNNLVDGTTVVEDAFVLPSGAGARAAGTSAAAATKAKRAHAPVGKDTPLSQVTDDIYSA